jgi:hypothetical protein
MAVRVYSACALGMDGQLIEVEVDLAPGFLLDFPLLILMKGET